MSDPVVETIVVRRGGASRQPERQSSQPADADQPDRGRRHRRSTGVAEDRPHATCPRPARPGVDGHHEAERTVMGKRFYLARSGDTDVKLLPAEDRMRGRYDVAVAAVLRARLRLAAARNAASQRAAAGRHARTGGGTAGEHNSRDPANAGKLVEPAEIRRRFTAHPSHRSR